MRILKILMGIILVLVAVFFLAGLVKPTVNYSIEVNIAKPVDKTFYLFNDIKFLSRYVPGMRQASTLAAFPGITGNRYRIIREIDGEMVTIIQDIKEYDYNHRVIRENDFKKFIKAETITFLESENNTTNITAEVTYNGIPYLDRCKYAFFKGSLMNPDLDHFDRFKMFADRYTK